MPTVASYCTTFLKPEMLHLYRQITGLKEWETFVITKERQNADLFPFAKDRIELAPAVKSNFIRRFWLKHILCQPPIIYRGEYGALAKVLERRFADVLHVYFGHTGVHLLPFLEQWPKASVVSFHGMDVQTRGHDPSYELKLRKLLQTTTLVLARSYSLQDRLLELGCPPEKLRMNRTGIPLDQFEYFEREAPSDGAWRFVQACRLIEKKGLDDAIHAFARFAVKYPKATFTIAGEGPLLASLEALRDSLGLRERVHFAGFLKGDQLCKLYDRSHIFVHPSRITADGNQEGIPNSMLEAMATGLPVIATQHGGIPEAVRDGITGLLVPERDVDGLYDSMLSLAQTPYLWKTMSAEAGADMKANFESSAQIAKLEAVYAEAQAIANA